MSYPMDSLIHGGGLRYKNGIAGEVVTAYQVVYGAGDGRWYLADADVGTSEPLMGLTVDPAIVAQKSRILIKGIIQNNTWTWTPGQPIYLSQVTGGMTQTAPILPARTQVVGAAITADTIWFEVEGAGLGGGATGCALLEGATAFVGFDDCKEPFTNYFLCDGVADDVQIQEAIDYVNGLNGGTVKIESGLYHISSKILLNGHGIKLSGATMWRGKVDTTTPALTGLILDNNVDDDMILITGRKCTIENLYLEGNWNNQASGNGIVGDVDASLDLHLFSLYLVFFKETGVVMSGGVASVVNVVVEFCQEHSFSCLATHGTYVNCLAWDPVNDGFFIGGAYNKFIGCTAYSCEHGFSIIQPAKNVVISGCEVVISGKYGIRLVGGKYSTITGNSITNPGIESDNTYSGIVMHTTGGTHATYNTVTGNIVYSVHANSPDYGIEEFDANNNYNTIVGNTVFGYVTLGVRRLGPNSMARSNIGYVNENNVLSPAFSIAAVAVIAVVIPHGLDITPAIEDCQLTVIEDTDVDDWEEGYVKIESVDAANVNCKVNVTNASATGGATAKLALRVITV